MYHISKFWNSTGPYDDTYPITVVLPSWKVIHTNTQYATVLPCSTAIF